MSFLFALLFGHIDLSVNTLVNVFGVITLVSIDLCSHPGNYTHASVCAHIQVITLMLSAHIQVITLMPA